MKKERYLALLLAGGMLAQPFLSAAVPLETQAAGETWVSVSDLTKKETAEPKKDSVVPSPNQYEYQKQELAAFCHFGMNTYTGKEWGDGNEKPSQFKLSQKFDADTYVKAIKDAGFKKIIVTAKHHDGFCIWPSEYTEHDTAAAGYDGDVLAEISAACTEQGVDMGLYLSPWDVNHESYGYYDEEGNPLVDSKGNPKDDMTWEQVEAKDVHDYNEYYNNQLKEILEDDKYGRDGHFAEIWMDGAKGEGSAVQNYNFTKWFETIQKNEGKGNDKYQDDCLQFGSGAHTTVHWIGNEAGLANEETWAKINVDEKNNTFDSNKKPGSTYAVGYPNGAKWSVPEADTKITSGWFWGESKKTPLSMEQLSDIYFRSVGHNATLLLNVPPNTQGTVDANILARLDEFGKAVKNTFKDNLAEGAEIKATNVREDSTEYSPANVLDGEDETYWTVNDGTQEAKLLIDLKETKTFDVVSIEEAIQFGQRIGSFKVEYQNKNGEWKIFDKGTTIGAKRLCRKSPVKADKLKITVTVHANAENKIPMLSEVGVYQATGGFELGNGIPQDLTVIDDRKFEKSEGWKQESPENSLEGTSMWANGNKSNQPWAQTTFTGTKVWLIGTIDPNHGPADIYIDNKKVGEINTHSDSRKMMQRIFESETLENTQHTIKLVNTGTDKQAIGLDAALVLNNDGKGMIEIEKDSYRVNEDTTMPITLRRVGGTKGEVKVQFEVSPGSAWQKHFDADGNMEVTFKDGEDTAQASITTYRVGDKDGDVYFTVNLSGPTDGAITGFTSKAKITIVDTESYSKADLQDKVKRIEAEYAEKESLYTTSSYAALQAALKEARKVLKVAHPLEDEMAQASAALDVALASLIKRQAFSAEDAFVLPKIRGTKKSVETEYFVLDASGATDKEKTVRIVEDADASNGKKVGWFEDGNVIKLPFYADKAGTYMFKARYQSGRTADNPNTLKWKGTNITEGEISVTGSNPNGTDYQELEFEITVNEAGDGELIFYADSTGAPNLDKFEVTAKDVSSGEFKIAVKAGENGRVLYGDQIIEAGQGAEVTVLEGSTPMFTFVPDAKTENDAESTAIDYAVEEVVVDGEPVGPMDSYIFEEIGEDGHSISVTFEKAIYDEESRFEFPIDGRTKTLEAERFQLTNAGDENERWKLEVKTDAEWASGKKFVNSMNADDKITLYYNAEQPGTYDVTVYYRSGNAANAFEWEEKEQKIENGSITAGASDSAAVTHQVTFKLNVTKEGKGCLVFTAPESGAPQLDKFEVKSTKPLIPPANTVRLEAAIQAAEEVVLEDYKDGDAKANFEIQLAKAKELMERINGGEVILQDVVDAMAKALEDATEALEYKDQTPAVDKRKLSEAIAKAKALELNKYQEEGKAEFAEALKNAESVLADAKATDEDVSEALLSLNTAMANLKPIDTGSGNDGNIGNGGNTGNTGNSGSGNSQSGNPSAVKTGDAQNPFVYIMTMIFAAVVLLGAKKKFNR